VTPCASCTPDPYMAVSVRLMQAEGTREAVRAASASMGRMRRGETKTLTYTEDERDASRGWGEPESRDMDVRDQEQPEANKKC
jgi:hypothetical protein